MTMHFGRFEWRPHEQQLRREGQPIALGARALDLLAELIAHRDRVVTKDELIAAAWPHVVVAENNLSVQMAALRKLLGDDAVQTISGRGYRWALPIIGPAAAHAASVRGKPSIAVLPFTNLSGDPGQDYVAEGLAADIEAALTRSPWLFVVSGTGAGRLRELSAGEAARQLGVAYLVRGTVRRSDSQLRVNAEMLNGDSVVWAERYDRPLADLFAVQDDISLAVVSTIEPLFLKNEEQTASRAASRDLQHWDLLMRARWHYWRSSLKDITEAKRLFQQALALRPDDSNTLSLLAFSLATEVWSGWSADPKASAVEARRLAMRAVAIDERDAFAHFALGVALLSFAELDRAIDEQRRAVDLYPQFAAASAELGRLLAYRGQSEEGERHIRRAMACCPTDPRKSLWVFSLGIACVVDSRWADGAAHARAAIGLRPDWFFNHQLLAACSAMHGDQSTARAAAAEAMRLAPRLTIAALRAGNPFARPTDRDRYEQALHEAGWRSA